MTSSSDLNVDIISDALDGYTIDVVVGGSIGAVEAPRFIRSLRRLGAQVNPWLSQGGLQFTTETAISWAAANPVVTRFSGNASHIALGDACVIAPASASIIAKIALGITDTPTTALVASYLGQNKPVLFVPNMHKSLYDSPIVQQNISTLASFCTPLNPRQEEGKLKFPEPSVLADKVAHCLNQQRKLRPVIVAMGTTRGYIDDIRYISNYSSGALGSKISEELYRQGHHTHVIKGPCPIQPKTYSEMTPIDTNDELQQASLKQLDETSALVFASSVLDFVPSRKTQGKIRSSDDLKVDFIPTEKIISKLHTKSGKKVGFKLEAELDLDQAKSIAADYMTKYSLSLMVINGLKDVDHHRHRAYMFTDTAETGLDWTEIKSKTDLASAIARHIRS